MIIRAVLRGGWLLSHSAKAGVAGTIAAIAIVSSCSSGPASNGPLELGGDPGALCVPSLKGQAVTVDDALTNSGDSEITIEEVSLVEPQELSLEAAYLVPIAHMDDGSYLQLGVWDEFPPPFDEEEPTYPELQNTWNARVDAVGATVDPGETLDLVVGLAPSTRGDGTARAIRVIYVESNGESYTAETTTEIRIAVGRKSCF